MKDKNTVAPESSAERVALWRALHVEKKPAIIASTGVSMYLTKDANLSALKQVSALASGSMKNFCPICQN